MLLQHIKKLKIHSGRACVASAACSSGIASVSSEAS